MRMRRHERRDAGLFLPDRASIGALLAQMSEGPSAGFEVLAFPSPQEKEMIKLLPGLPAGVSR